MGKLKNKMEMQLKLEGYSPRTMKTYLLHMKQLVVYYAKEPKSITTDEIEKCLLYLIDEKQVSRSHVNQAVNAINISMAKY